MILLKPSQIKPNPENPRIIKDEAFYQLVASIKAFPKMMELRPVVIDENFMILGGDKRFSACKELKWKQIPTEQALGLTDEQKREFTIKDNLHAGEWDYGKLQTWDNKELEAWGLDVPDFGPPRDPFDDPGIVNKSQYGVIVICKGEKDQESIFKQLSDLGLTCKVVVT